jgi:hypothetical protein
MKKRKAKSKKETAKTKDEPNFAVQPVSRVG